MMYRYFTTFIFLFAILFDIEAQDFRRADSLMGAGNYELAAVEYERCRFLSTSMETSRQALRQKAECYKHLQQFANAAATLERYADSYPDHLQLALCSYLSGHYARTTEVAHSAELLFDTITNDMLLLWVLSLNEMQMYDSAYSIARRITIDTSSLSDQSFQDTLASIYASVPTLKKESVARILSIIPGLGHLYAGYPLEAATAFLLNSAAVAFGVWQVLSRCYITAYIGGAGLLSSTFPGAIRSAGIHAQKYNKRQAARFNSHCSERIMNVMYE